MTYVCFSPDWGAVMEVPGDQTTATVHDLIENGVYEFRVRAVNKGGAGEPSDSTGPHIAKPKNCKYEILKVEFF